MFSLLTHAWNLCDHPSTANAFQCCAIARGGRDRFLFQSSGCNHHRFDGEDSPVDLSHFQADDANIAYALRATAGDLDVVLSRVSPMERHSPPTS